MWQRVAVGTVVAVAAVACGDVAKDFTLNPASDLASDSGLSAHTADASDAPLSIQPRAIALGVGAGAGTLLDAGPDEHTAGGSAGSAGGSATHGGAGSPESGHVGGSSGEAGGDPGGGAGGLAGAEAGGASSTEGAAGTGGAGGTGGDGTSSTGGDAGSAGAPEVPVLGPCHADPYCATRPIHHSPMSPVYPWTWAPWHYPTIVEDDCFEVTGFFPNPGGRQYVYSTTRYVLPNGLLDTPFPSGDLCIVPSRYRGGNDPGLRQGWGIILPRDSCVYDSLAWPTEVYCDGGYAVSL